MGRELLNEARQIAVDRGCTRLWLITTNDNTRAIAFYEAWGMSRVAEHLGAVDRSRASLKPTISTHGANGAPIRDEFEYELRLEVGD